jgi:hypothetical protein
VVRIGLGLDFLNGGWLVDVVGIFFDAVSDGTMIFLIFKNLVHEIVDSGGKGVIIVFTVSVDDGGAVLDCGLIAVK